MTESSGWQPQAWFPPAELQLSGRLAGLREVLPLPLEQIRQPDPVSLADLSEKIEYYEKDSSVIPLAHNLTSRELGQVFPLLAAVSLNTAPSRDAARQAMRLHNRLLLILRERACSSLYQSGWLAYQFYYPCEPLAEALAVLCRIVDIKRQSRHAGFYEPIGDYQAIRLISELAIPDGRQFPSRLVRTAVEKGLSLDQLFEKYAIQADLPFGIALAVRYFIDGDAGRLENQHKLFGRTLRLANEADQAALLHHFFALKRIPEQVRNRCCQQIYRVFDDPAAGRAVWDEVKPRDRQAFQRWVREATIGSHCRQHPEKARFYLGYSAFIERVEQWDKETLLIYFPGFTVADSRLRPDLAICYDRQASGHPFELANAEFNPSPADPAIPRRSIEDAIRGGDFGGVIGLPLDPHGIRLTAVLLDMRLKGRRTKLAGTKEQGPTGRGG